MRLASILRIAAGRLIQLRKQDGAVPGPTDQSARRDADDPRMERLLTLSRQRWVACSHAEFMTRSPSAWRMPNGRRWRQQRAGLTLVVAVRHCPYHRAIRRVAPARHSFTLRVSVNRDCRHADRWPSSAGFPGGISARTARPWSGHRLQRTNLTLSCDTQSRGHSTVAPTEHPGADPLWHRACVGDNALITRITSPAALPVFAAQ